MKKAESHRSQVTGRGLVVLVVVMSALGVLAQTTTPTYYRDIKPILDRHCVGCHITGGIAPFSLTDPQEAVQRAAVIAGVTSGNYMPPWPPGGDSPTFLNERKLSAEEKALLVAWAQTGAALR
ncbi:MAG: cytochrome c [Meiothermus sp.]|nr:cytochrome c [Meiothermus sp.]